MLGAALDAVLAPVLVLDASGALVFANRALVEATGRAGADLAGAPARSLFSEEEPGGPWQEAWAAVADGRSWTGEGSLLRRSGEAGRYSLRAAPVRGEDGRITHAVVLCQDLAEWRQAQARLLLADRMVSVGILAAGVAHEINNPLAFLLTNLNFAADRMAELERGGLGAGPALALRDLKDAIEEAREGAVRVRDIVRDLRIFSRGEDGERGPVDVERVLESSIKMAWNEIRHRARLVRDFGGVPPVQAEEARLAQVFLNLIVNAVQAISEGDVRSNEIRVATRIDERGWVVAEVRDSGRGIPEAVRGRLFEPFFTTKPVGVGTGLGLYVCRDIVASLGGEIAFESAEGRGSVFRVRLPAAGPPRVEGARTPSPSSWPAPERGSVLVVDDEPMMGSTLTRILGAHDVVAVGSASEALALLDAGRRFDVILCDLMMPGMGGVELHAELQRRAPEAARRMIFLSGGALTAAAHAFSAAGTHPMVEKPFDAAALRVLVARRVSESRAAAAPVASVPPGTAGGAVP